MRLGIEASNLRRGGGVTHLREILQAADPRQFGFEEVTVWGGEATLATLPTQEWLRLVPLLRSDTSAASRIWWQTIELTRVARTSCDVLFIPGGSYFGSFRPFVTMSQNLLPFQPMERRRYGASLMFAKLCLLEKMQSYTMRRSQGAIFLTEFARHVVESTVGKHGARAATIPHGVDDGIRLPPRRHRRITECTLADPFRLSYVSIIDVYKHQWHVAEAVAALRAQGLPITINFWGPSYPPALRRLQDVLNRLDPRREFLIYDGAVHHQNLRNSYHSAEGFVFASSCENLPIILLEAMAAGLPIASSDRDPMPEVLGETGFYFDPERSSDIARALRAMILDHDQRGRFAERAFARATEFSWPRCAELTYRFIHSVIDETSA